ncbi:GNAT family N-acetyltransferase [Candidatus Poribacteria bacterium]|nr:GNAT family N-acetyltransferase [Candidatus Poribacteria bacterium]
MVEIQSHNDANELISLSGAYLELNESENSLPIGLSYRLAENFRYYGPESPLLLSILEQGRAVGVAIMTPPRRLILSRFETSVEVAMVHLTRYLRGIDMPIPGVAGPATEAQVFSHCWIEGIPSVSSKPVMRLRIFEARKVADLPLSPGKLRLACMADQPLMMQWIAAFSEAIGEPVDSNTARSNVEQYIEDRQLYIWDDGGPVSIATETRPTRNGTTISTVYTPPEYRNKGYATSCVCALTKELLSDRYSFCSLYTDLSNPTSNSIYAKIGYVPLGDALSFDFVPSAH